MTLSSVTIQSESRKDLGAIFTEIDQDIKGQAINYMDIPNYQVWLAKLGLEKGRPRTGSIY